LILRAGARLFDSVRIGPRPSPRNVRRCTERRADSKDDLHIIIQYRNPP
jgi:hypothetical protein